MWKGNWAPLPLLDQQMALWSTLFSSQWFWLHQSHLFLFHVYVNDLYIESSTMCLSPMVHRSVFRKCNTASQTAQEHVTQPIKLHGWNNDRAFSAKTCLLCPTDLCVSSAHITIAISVLFMRQNPLWNDSAYTDTLPIQSNFAACAN